MIMIGYMIKKAGVMPYENVEKVMAKVVPAKTLNLAGIIGAACYAKTKLEKQNRLETNKKKG